MGGIEHLPGEKRVAYPPEPLDSFGRLKVVNPFSVFDMQFYYDLQPLWFEQSVVNGSVTHLPDISGVRLSTGGTTSGNRALFQTRQYFQYQPNRSHHMVWTCILGDPANNVQKTIGLIDDNDGLAFMQDSTGLSVIRRSSTSGSPVDVVIDQADWNLDPLNGEGPSGVDLDISKDNIFIIDMQWLGAGRVRYGFDFGGHTTYVHQVQFANTEDVPFMKTANLPFRVEIENTGVADAEETCDFVCVAIGSEGGSERDYIKLSTSNAVAAGGAAPLRAVNTGNAPVPILSIKPRTAFNGLTNRSLTRPLSCQIGSQNAAITYSVVLNGSLTGASFADVDTTNSAVEVDVAATAISGGVVVESGYLGGEPGALTIQTKEVDLRKAFLSNNIAGDTTDVLTLVIGLATATSSNCGGGFTWTEQR